MNSYTVQMIDHKSLKETITDNQMLNDVTNKWFEK